MFFRSTVLLAMFAGKVMSNAENSQGKVSRSDPHSQTNEQLCKYSFLFLLARDAVGREVGGGRQLLRSPWHQSPSEGKMSGKINILNNDLLTFWAQQISNY
jgi:hypothetical protein